MIDEKGFYSLINEYAKDIITSEGFESSKSFIQHGDVSVFDHSINVTIKCMEICHKLKLKLDTRSLIRGSLLHDYFLYDWHDPDPSHRLHGFHHAKRSLANASRDFELNDLEKNMILTHMFPLNLRFPKYKEAWILTLSDKLVAIRETFKIKETIH